MSIHARLTRLKKLLVLLLLLFPTAILSDFSDNLLQRYEISEKLQKEKGTPLSQVTDLEQKKPRRKDTPAIHIPPLVTGKRVSMGYSKVK